MTVTERPARRSFQASVRPVNPAPTIRTEDALIVSHSWLRVVEEAIGRVAPLDGAVRFSLPL